MSSLFNFPGNCILDPKDQGQFGCTGGASLWVNNDVRTPPFLSAQVLTTYRIRTPSTFLAEKLRTRPLYVQIPFLIFYASGAARLSGYAPKTCRAAPGSELFNWNTADCNPVGHQLVPEVSQ